MVFSFLGFEPQVKKVFLTNDIKLDVALVPGSTDLGELEVTAQRLGIDNVRQTQMSVIDIPVRLIESFPVILSEHDVLKVLQLLPGVQGGQEGTTSFHVRGGNIDQNLVQLDEATVYNPNHLFGLFSTFNSRALNNVTLVKGGFPANYGGRLSSIVEINMREGNKRNRVVQGGLGLITSQLSVEGPIKRDKGSFIVSGRRSYLDVVARPFQTGKTRNTYYFYDVNGKANYSFGDQDRVYLSLFQGRDLADYVAGSGLGYGIRFGNRTATLRWNHLFGSKLFSNVSLMANEYFLRISTIQERFFSQNFSGIEDLTAKAEFQYYPIPAHNIRFGAIATRHRFRSTGVEGGVVKDLVIPAFDESNIIPQPSNEYAVYVNDRWEINNRLGVNVGVRVPHYSVEGVSYTRVEPRFSIKVAIDDRSSVKASYTVMNQFVHSVPSTTASLPTDIWIASSEVTRPQFSEQVALGFFRNFDANRYETSLELYYKRMKNQVLFKQGTQLLEYANIDDELTFGEGWSYGAEFFIKRSYGLYTGWASYTLSKTEQKFAELNLGRKFPFRYDRRHNLALAGALDLTPKWKVSADFVFQTGPAYTLPTGRLFSAQAGNLYNGLFYDYERLNNYRLRSTHRLDVSATRKIGTRLFKESELVIGIYNVYSRLNPYYVFLDLDINTGEPIGKQVSLLPIVPSVSFNFTF
jgi:hypothetical protein